MKHAEKYNTDNGKGSFAVSFHMDSDTEFNIKENTTNGDVIRIGNLRIFLSREDLEMLADSIAAYTGGEFITEKAVRKRDLLNQLADRLKIRAS